MKSVFILILIIGFASVSIFGLMQFSHTNHTPEAPMVNCPYTANSYSLCENIFDHVNKWQQFSNTVVLPLFVFLFLILGIVLSIFSKQDFLNQNNYFYKWKYSLYDKNLFTYQEKITKWLSLFENSPSFSYVRHS